MKCIKSKNAAVKSADVYSHLNIQKEDNFFVVVINQVTYYEKDDFLSLIH